MHGHRGRESVHVWTRVSKEGGRVGARGGGSDVKKEVFFKNAPQKD